MKHFLLTSPVTISLFLFSLGLNIILPTSNVIFAAPPTTPTEGVVDEPIAQIDCFGGKEQFASFLRSFISVDQFEGYFKDLQMNACQYTAAKVLRDDMKKMREEIRDAFYTCDSKEATELRIKYYRKDAELYFLRNVVTTHKGKLIAADLNQLKTKMHQRFVKKLGYFTEEPPTEGEEGVTDRSGLQENWDEVWGEFVTSYDPQYYIECKGDIELIADKIESLRTTIESIAAEFRNTKGEVEEQQNADKKEPSPRLGGGGDAELKLNALNIFARTVNQVSPQRFSQDILRDMQNKTLTQLEIATLIAEEERRYKLDLRRAEALARFKAKYQHTSDAISQDYSIRINTVIDTINNATQNLQNVTSCIEFTNESQCSQEG